MILKGNKEAQFFGLCLFLLSEKIGDRINKCRLFKYVRPKLTKTPQVAAQGSEKECNCTLVFRSIPRGGFHNLRKMQNPISTKSHSLFKWANFYLPKVILQSQKLGAGNLQFVIVPFEGVEAPDEPWLRFRSSLFTPLSTKLLTNINLFDIFNSSN